MTDFIFIVPILQQVETILSTLFSSIWFVLSQASQDFDSDPQHLWQQPRQEAEEVNKQR